jgi:SOS response regulatory protein OraA/RecX
LTDAETDRPSAYAKAVDLLSRRAHFSAQLRDKLARRGYPPEEVEEALARLARHGYLDDRAAARDFAAGRLAREPLGRRRLAADLARRGAPEEVVAEVLDELLPGDDRAAARDFAAGRLAREPLGRRRLAADLARRGAPEEVVAEVLDEILPGDDRAAAREAAETWLARRRNPSKPALARWLERRGFSPPAIWGALGAVDWPAADGEDAGD